MDIQTVEINLRTWFSLIPAAIIVLSPAADASPGKSHRIPGVPFIRQTRNNCGPAALAMVLGYYRVRVGQEELAEEIRPDLKRGALNLDLLLAARKHGFDALMPRGDLAAVKDYLREDIPVIAMIETSPGSKQFHFLVIYGYDDTTENLLVHSGGNRALSLPYRRFISSWAPAENWMMVIRRRDYPRTD